MSFGTCSFAILRCILEFSFQFANNKFAKIAVYVCWVLILGVYTGEIYKFFTLGFFFFSSLENKLLHWSVLYVLKYLPLISIHTFLCDDNFFAVTIYSPCTYTTMIIYFPNSRCSAARRSLVRFWWLSKLRWMCVGGEITLSLLYSRTYSYIGGTTIQCTFPFL